MSYNRCNSLLSEIKFNSLISRINYIVEFQEIAMTRNLLAKFKKPLQQSSRIVYESRISPDQQDWLQASGHMTQTKKDSDRTSFYKSVAFNFQTNKMLQKIPILIKENEDLKFKVQQLQQQINCIEGLAFKRSNQSIKEDKVYAKKVELEKSMLKILKQCKPLLKHKKRLYSSSGRFSTEAIDSNDEISCKNCHLRQKNALKLSNEAVLKLQRERDQLKYENQQILAKLNEFYQRKQINQVDIDDLNASFKKILEEKQNLFSQQSNFYQQQLTFLQSKLAQIQGQNQIIKLNNSSLQDKIAKYELQVSNLRQKYLGFQRNQMSNYGNLIYSHKPHISPTLQSHQSFEGIKLYNNT